MCRSFKKNEVSKQKKIRRCETVTTQIITTDVATMFLFLLRQHYQFVQGKPAVVPPFNNSSHQLTKFDSNLLITDYWSNSFLCCGWHLQSQQQFLWSECYGRSDDCKPINSWNINMIYDYQIKWRDINCTHKSPIIIHNRLLTV